MVILRQDLISLRRARKHVQVVLALPEHLDLLPCLLARAAPGGAADSLQDYYDAAPVLVGVAPSALLADIACVHRSVRVCGGDRSEQLAPAEIVARQVEAADALVLAGPFPDAGQEGQDIAVLLRHLNLRARLVTLGRVAARQPASGRVFTRPQPSAPMYERWEFRSEPVCSPRLPPEPGHVVSTLVWNARGPLHPERLRDALAQVMPGVLRNRGQLWLASDLASPTPTILTSRQGPEAAQYMGGSSSKAARPGATSPRNIITGQNSG
ncbi:GTP-binding protein [Streptomyces parvus]|uniref:GTP-binding protein n=1 Tax=Streptomyces parvus TaxID=66428 RepID=UPI00210105AD|nr:GTP-binding protein [Streptomyces parvus]MCQ1581495.1 GTP-binding protein [Streptomyces parvus]